LETLGFPGKMRKCHAETTKPSGKSGVIQGADFEGNAIQLEVRQIAGRQLQAALLSGNARWPGPSEQPPTWRCVLPIAKAVEPGGRFVQLQEFRDGLPEAVFG
jgi:hypothetical protein